MEIAFQYVILNLLSFLEKNLMCFEIPGQIKPALKNPYHVL